MKYAVVLGRHEAVWDELRQVKDMLPGQPLTIVAVKRAGRDYDGPVHHWVSFHHDIFQAWAEERAAHNRPPAENYWSCIHRLTKRPPRSIMPINWLINIGGSSGLLGVQVAVQPELELDKIILCGMPMEASARYDTNTAWNEALAYREPWRLFKPSMGDRVRSMSGWTKELLGEVTERWLTSPSLR